MTYPDLVASEQALHPMSEPEALSLVIQAKSKRTRAWRSLRRLGTRSVRGIVRFDG
jgi:hypothetical protein